MCFRDADHGKPPPAAPGSTELLQFMEREVPPEIRRYVSDEAKLAEAQKDLQKIWNRPRPSGDPQAETEAVQLVRACLCIGLVGFML